MAAFPPRPDHPHPPTAPGTQPRPTPSLTPSPTPPSLTAPGPRPGAGAPQAPSDSKDRDDRLAYTGAPVEGLLWTAAGLLAAGSALVGFGRFRWRRGR